MTVIAINNGSRQADQTVNDGSGPTPAAFATNICTIAENGTNRRIRKTPDKRQCSNARLFLIALASFIMYFSSWGLGQGFGVMFIALQEEFGSSKTATTWVSSVFAGVLHATGPLSGIFIKHFGCRMVGVSGSLFLVTGLVSSFFTPSLSVLYITYGLIGGLGASQLFTTAACVVLQNFDKYRSLVTGITLSGASLGILLIPLFTEACLEKYGFRGTFLLLGGFAMQCLVASLAFPSEEPIQDIDPNTERTGQRSVLKSLVSLFSFFNVGFATYSISWAVFMLSFLVPCTLLPDAAMVAGLSLQQSSYTAAALGIGSVIGTFSFSFLGDVRYVETTLLHIVPIILFGLLSLGFNLISTPSSFMALAALFGFTAAMADGIHPMIVFQLVGPQHLSVGLGTLYFIMSITTVVGSPIAGWIADITGEYTNVFFYCAGCSFLAASVAIFIPIWKRRRDV